MTMVTPPNQGSTHPDETSCYGASLARPLIDDKGQNHQRRHVRHPGHRTGDNLDEGIRAWAVASGHLNSSRLVETARFSVVSSSRARQQPQPVMNRIKTKALNNEAEFNQ